MTQPSLDGSNDVINTLPVREKSVSAAQAGKTFGLNSRYDLHLQKKYGMRVETIKSWALLFKEEGLLEEDSKFLV